VPGTVSFPGRSLKKGIESSFRLVAMASPFNQ
jgi:hypothetical protein